MYTLAGRSLDGFAKSMQREVARVGKVAWMIATGDDLRLPTTTGATANRAMRWQHRYLDRVMAASTSDETVLAAMMDVFFLLRPPTSLFNPRIMRRALRRHSGPPVVTAPSAPTTATRLASASHRTDAHWAEPIHSSWS